ncbi:MAG TPA: hypothetical protein VJ752_21185 [Burkholderiaceae bacterium]|nr:hypothetical protein [Burkholderiaceae bacterium]
MTSALFDSHKYAKRLIAAGVSATAADVQAETMLEVMNQIAATSATGDKQNSNIDRLDAKIDRSVADLKAQNAELKAMIEQAKGELIRWAVGLAIAIVGAMSALKLIH